MSTQTWQRFQQDLEAKICARTPILAIETFEEERLLDLLFSVSKRLEMRTLVWSSTTGFQELLPGPEDRWQLSIPPELETSNDQLKAQLKDFLAALDYFEDSISNLNKQGSLLVCLDPFPFLDQRFDNQLNHRKLKDLYREFQVPNKTILLVGPVLTPIPTSLEKAIVLCTFPLPDHSFLLDQTRIFLKDQDDNLEENEKLGPTWFKEHSLDQFAQAGRGLTWEEYKQSLSEAVATETWPADLLLQAKKQAIRKTGLLEYVEPNIKLEDVGGLDLFKDYLQDSQIALEPENRALGAPIPKGVILAGLPGTGKSLAAKMLGNAFNLPLLRYDPSRIGTSLYGETERNMRKALELVEALQPNILWIDEMEKAFASGSGETDSGVSERTKGILLTWLQEKTGYTFVVGTLNHLENLPPELSRAGRFDLIFHVDLPNRVEREEIFRIHIYSRKNPGQTKIYNPEEFDLEELVAATEKFTGAEIEANINRSLLRAIRNTEAFTTEHILETLKTYIPESERPLVKIQQEAMKAALAQCQPASSKVSKVAPARETGKKVRIVPGK